MREEGPAEEETAEDLADDAGCFQAFEQSAQQVGTRQQQRQCHQRHDDLMFCQSR